MDAVQDTRIRTLRNLCGHPCGGNRNDALVSCTIPRWGLEKKTYLSRDAMIAQMNRAIAATTLAVFRTPLADGI